MKKFILFILLFPLSAMAELKVGDLPPSFLGKDRQGQAVQLSEMKGKVVVVTFWASYCPPCLKEMSVLEKIQGQVGKNELEIVAVNFKENQKQFLKIKRKLKDFSVTLTHDKRGKISRRYGVKHIPHMFIINKAGLIEKIHLGYGDSFLDQLVSELNVLLST